MSNIITAVEEGVEQIIKAARLRMSHTLQK